MAEFGNYFGYEGIRAILNNEITLSQAEQLIQGSRKLWAGRVADHAEAAFAGAASAQSKKPAVTFRKMLKSFRKAAKP